MNLDNENSEFQSAFELIQETNQSFFLTGKAGTGKSTFLKHVVKSVSKNFIVIAPTGLAAVNVGGVTIHSFFQFPLRPLLPEDNEIKIFWENSDKHKLISTLDTIIIDEISMVRADIIDGIDCSLRRNGGNPNLPFGGKQIVFVGDIFQLEPIAMKKSGELKIINEIYGSTYFYFAKVFQKITLISIELQKVYRQNDMDFISLLDKVRVDEISKHDLNVINSRVISSSELLKNDFVITLTTKNDLADNVNSQKLIELNTKPLTFFAEVSGEFDESKYPTTPELTLKVGAQIIFIKNDFEKRWVNGSIGMVVDLADNEIKVKLSDGSIYKVEKQNWENLTYKYNKEERKIEQEIIGTFRQYPLKLAWAITIHKSQGLTFDKVIIDFGSGTFASGQAYVALSRVTSFEGLFLIRNLNSTDIFIDNEIKEFAKTFNKKERITESLSEWKQNYTYIKNKNIERLGGISFQTAIYNIDNGNFAVAYNELLLGFDYVSCDCFLSKIINENYDSLIQSFKTKAINCSAAEIDFLRAVFYFFSNKAKQKEFFQKALSFIDSFIEEDSNLEIGHYIRGRILSQLGKYIEALVEFEWALSIKETSRINYRIGRIKEELLGTFGVDYLYRSIIINPSSLCALRWFKNQCILNEIKFETDADKLLAYKFNVKDNTEEFIKIVNYLLLNGNIKLKGGRVLTASIEFDYFIKSLETDEYLFTREDDDDEHYYNYLNDSDTSCRSAEDHNWSAWFNPDN